MKKKEKVAEEEVHVEEIKDQSMETEDSKDEASEVPVEEDELTVLKRQNEEMNDKFLRLYSEFDNFRKRTQKEKLDLYKTAGEDVIVSILPVLDDLERALKSIDENEDIKDIKQGLTLINQKIQNSLNQQGLKSIDSSVGKVFDVDMHEAISKIPAPEKKLKGKVIDEVEKGYMLNEKVIRYTKVVIGE